MKKIVRLTEVELKNVIKNVINEKTINVNEAGRKGLWKSKWNEEDQMLAMYNSLYGIEELGVGNKEYVAHNIIGSSLAAFNQQSSNFDYLDGRNGLDRPNEMQTIVYNKYKNTPKNEFKRICTNIVDKREKNPEESVIRKKLGDEIGSKKKQIELARRSGLLAKGKNPDNMKLIRSVLKTTPDDEENFSEPKRISEKEEIKKFIKDIIDRVNNIKSKSDLKDLSNDLEFLFDYIDNILPDESSINQNVVAEMRYVFKSSL